MWGPLLTGSSTMSRTTSYGGIMQNTKFPQNKTLNQSAVRNPKAGEPAPAQNKGNFPQGHELGPEDGKN